MMSLGILCTLGVISVQEISAQKTGLLCALAIELCSGILEICTMILIEPISTYLNPYSLKRLVSQ